MLVAMTSSSLDSPPMISIEQQKARRRERLAELLKEVKPVQLVDLLHANGTPLSAAMLYQMSRGTGKSLRHANDQQARAIEKAAGKWPGWLDALGTYPDPHGLALGEPTDASVRDGGKSAAQLTSRQALLRQTLDVYLPSMTDQQADALRAVILAMRASSVSV